MFQKIFFISLMTLSTLSLQLFDEWDHHGHNHEAAVESPLNGGILRDAPPFKAELVIENDDAKIYLYKKVGTELQYTNIKAEELVGKFSHLKMPKPVQKKGGIEVKFIKSKERKSVKIGDKTIEQEVQVFKAKLEGSSKVHRYDLHVNLVNDDAKKVVIDFGIDNIN